MILTFCAFIQPNGNNLTSGADVNGAAGPTASYVPFNGNNALPSSGSGTSVCMALVAGLFGMFAGGMGMLAWRT